MRKRNEKGPVLVVDDDPLLALDIADMVERAGFEACETAFSVASAMRLIHKRQPSFAFLDFHLGPETSARIACELERRHVPYAYVTGQPAAVLRDPDTPRSTIIQKPADSAAVRSALLNALPQRRVKVA
jgi:ActR/RegA family two-component response regulator